MTDEDKNTKRRIQHLNYRLALLLLAVVASFVGLMLALNNYNTRVSQLDKVERDLNATLSAWHSMMGAARALAISEAPLPTLQEGLREKHSETHSMTEQLLQSAAAALKNNSLAEAVKDLESSMNPGHELLISLDEQIELLRKIDGGRRFFVERQALSNALNYMLSSNQLDESFFVIQKIRGLLRLIDVFSMDFETSEIQVRKTLSAQLKTVGKSLLLAQSILVLLIFVLLVILLFSLTRITIFLKNEVAARTALLQKKNKELSLTLQELQAMQENLIVTGKLTTLGRLAAGVAHEMNSPLAAIKSSSNYLLQNFSESFLDAANCFSTLTPEDKELFTQILALGLGSTKVLEPISSRIRRRVLVSELQQKGFSDAEVLTDELEVFYEIGVQDSILEWLTQGKREQVHNLFLLMDRIRSMQIIKHALDRAVLAISTLKTYSEETEEMRVELCKPVQDIRRVLALYEEKTRNSVHIHLQIHSDDAVESFSGDLFHVWNHLILNGLQAINYQGNLDIKIAKYNNCLQVQIEDNGKGIPESIQDRVFTPFITNKEKGEGLGLGLYTCYQIVNRHGGSISFSSKKGHTIFTVQLPIAGTQPETQRCSEEP